MTQRDGIARIVHRFGQIRQPVRTERRIERHLALVDKHSDQGHRNALGGRPGAGTRCLIHSVCIALQHNLALVHHEKTQRGLLRRLTFKRPARGGAQRAGVPGRAGLRGGCGAITIRPRQRCKAGHSGSLNCRQCFNVRGRLVRRHDHTANAVAERSANRRAVRTAAHA